MPAVFSEPRWCIDLNFSDDSEDSLPLLPVSHMTDRLNWLADVSIDEEGGMQLPTLRRQSAEYTISGAPSQSAEYTISHRTLDDYYRDEGIDYDPEFCSASVETQGPSRADSFTNGYYDASAPKAGAVLGTVVKHVAFDTTNYEAQRGVGVAPVAVGVPSAPSARAPIEDKNNTGEGAPLKKRPRASRAKTSVPREIALINCPVDHIGPVEEQRFIGVPSVCQCSSCFGWKPLYDFFETGEVTGAQELRKNCSACREKGITHYRRKKQKTEEKAQREVPMRTVSNGLMSPPRHMPEPLQGCPAVVQHRGLPMREKFGKVKVPRGASAYVDIK